MCALLWIIIARFRWINGKWKVYTLGFLFLKWLLWGLFNLILQINNGWEQVVTESRKGRMTSVGCSWGGLSLSPWGFKEEAKGLHWILNSVRSQGRFGVHCGLLCERNRQLRFWADLYQMVLCLFQSVTEEEYENTASRPCHFSYKNKSKTEGKNKTEALPSWLNS